MSLFSFFTKKENQLKCDWCGKEIETSNYTKHVGSKRFNFCSESCKKYFRKSGKGNSASCCCPTCPR